MRDFFAGITGHWPAGAEHYHWHVLPGPQIIDTQITRPYRELTHRAGLAPVQPRWSHITVQHFAPLGGPSDSQITQITGLVRDQCSRIAPFRAVIGLPQVQAAGIVCPVRPAAPLHRLWEATTTAGKDITGDQYEIRPDPYDPHLTLAYPCADVDDQPLRQWLSSYDAGVVTIEVTRLALVAQRHDCREITWRLLADIPLTGEDVPSRI